MVQPTPPSPSLPPYYPSISPQKVAAGSLIYSLLVRFTQLVPRYSVRPPLLPTRIFSRGPATSPQRPHHRSGSGRSRKTMGVPARHPASIPPTAPQNISRALHPGDTGSVFAHAPFHGLAVRLSPGSLLERNHTLHANLSTSRVDVNNTNAPAFSNLPPSRNTSLLSCNPMYHTVLSNHRYPP